MYTQSYKLTQSLARQTGIKQILFLILASFVVALFLLFSPSSARAETTTNSTPAGATLYYLQHNGDPRNLSTSYYLNTIDVASNGSATFGTPMLISGMVRNQGDYILSMTQLADGSLLGTYGRNGWARIFTISAADIADGGGVTATMGGAINTTIEGAFTGCDGSIYLGDSGSDNVGAGGSIIRLDPATLYDPMLGFTTVIVTAATDIDGLGPGIVGNEIVDSPGYALDSGNLLTWDYVSGTVTNIGQPGVFYELHALGGDRFDDGQARLFGLQSHPFASLTIQLREIDATVPSSTLVQSGSNTRASGLTGPMDCTVSSIPGGNGSTDTDGDGVPDDQDAFPNDPNETTDSDGDGVGDNADAFPNDPSETTDSDGDGVGDNADAFPNDPSETTDSDGDGVGDNADAFPNDPSETTDSDGDGVGDNADAFPNDPSETADSDGDGVGDNADAFPNDPSETTDSDGDGVGDNADAFPNDPSETTDSDGDGVGDNADAFPNDPSETTDSDGDGVGDNGDNCAIANPDQTDSNIDGQGDACDPIVTTVTSESTPVDINNQPVSASASFTDADDGDAHTTVFDWGDGTTSAGTVDQSANSVSGSHVYAEAGVYTVSVTVADGYGAEDTANYEFIVIYDPSGGFVTGGGWFDSPAGAYSADPTLTGRANYGFVSKYKKGANVPTGSTEFQFKAGDLNFHSSSYDWLVVAGQNKAKYKGTGTINGEGNYGFMITVVDNGNSGDTFRIKIWDKDSGNGVVYDNQFGAGDDAYDGTTIGGGNIKVHSGK